MQYAGKAWNGELERAQAGASSVFFVLQLQTDLAAARSAELVAKRDYEKAVFKLHFADGALLDENGLVLEIK